MEAICEMLKEQCRYVRRLDEETKEVIQEYTGSSYEILNKRLRNQEYLGNFQDMVDTLDRTFDDAPPTKRSITLYRGIDATEFINEVSSYISTTYNIVRARKSLGRRCCLLRILVSSGSQVLPIEEISEHPFEKEVLLPRTGRLEITNVDEEDAIAVYDLVYLPKKSVQIPRYDITQPFTYTI